VGRLCGESGLRWSITLAGCWTRGRLMCTPNLCLSQLQCDRVPLPLSPLIFLSGVGSSYARRAWTFLCLSMLDSLARSRTPLR
jgi:hypothetical protein